MNTLTEDIKKGAETFRQAEQTRKRTTAQLPVFREAYNLHTEVAFFNVRNGRRNVRRKEQEKNKERSEYRSKKRSEENKSKH